MEALQITWFVLIGVLLVGYAILDGFDLGTGILHLFARNDHERRIHLNAIGPVWDGNEVWLLTGGGALFAAFPPVYATVFSGLYMAFMLLLLALIARAVSMEFRSKLADEKWRRFWDWAFGLGSLIAAVLIGAAIGNILNGLPVTDEGTLSISFFSLLNPFALVVALLVVAMFVQQGALFMALKSEGELHERMVKWAVPIWIVFMALYIAATVIAVFKSPFLFDRSLANPLWWVTLVVMLAAVIYTPIANRTKKHLHAFLSSSLAVAAMTGLMGIGLFPRMVPSSIDLEYSLTIFNASSTERTLMTMLIITLIGVPIVLVYTFIIYRAFAGKVTLHKDSY